MSIKTLDLPRSGFYIVVVSYVAAGAFLWFGAQQPRLDEVFELLTQRDRGNFTGYTEQDVKVIEGVLKDYPGFSRALVGRSSAKFLEPRVNGWLKSEHAHLTVRPEKGKPTVLRLESQGSSTDYPATIVISGRNFVKKLTLRSEEPVNIEFSTNEVTKPSILKLEVSVAGRDQPSPLWGLRLVASNATSRGAQ
jgi:hypothetical protein